MAGIKVDHPPITFALVDPKTGRPTRAMVEFLHKMWLRTGGNDDNDQFIMQMLASGVPAPRMPPAPAEEYRHQPPPPGAIGLTADDTATAKAMAAANRQSNTLAQSASNKADDAYALAMQLQHSTTQANEAIESARLANLLAMTNRRSSNHDDRGLTPIGGIILWAGDVEDIPSGWALCDGTNGTPNLQDRFIRSATSNADIGTTGGQNETSITTDSATTGATVTTTQDSVSTGADLDALTSATIDDPGHAHTATISTVPEYYALALIQRIK
ncbi:MAG: hypothetical protein ACQES7_04305 [Pseudomonadota bacterium]